MAVSDLENLPSVQEILKQGNIHDVTWSGDHISAIVINYFTEDFEEQFHLVPEGDEIVFLDNQGNKFHTEDEVLKGVNVQTQEDLNKKSSRDGGTK